jgi:hypothetical protein
MPAVVASIVLALVLATAAALKLTSGPAGRAALATYGIHDETLAGVAWAALGALEAGLAIGVVTGAQGADYAAAALFAAFTGAQSAALIKGRAGAPCGCFGARGRISRASAGRAALLAVAFALLPLLDRRPLTTDEWLGIGLGFALAGVIALGVAVLALARELGSLKMSIGPQGALEIASEGPEVGGRTGLRAAFGAELDGGRLGLAVFTSDGCRVCQGLEPVVDAFARDPRVAVRRFDEVEDADAWAMADIPGSPFAVALGGDGTVLAKGTFNTGAQLESVLAAAERRRGALSA